MNWINKGEIVVYHNNTDNDVILYSPLARKQERIGEELYEEICSLETPPDFLKHLVDYVPFDERPHVNSPEDYTLLTVLPNNRCNFSCSYCYSASCRNATSMDIGMLRCGIEYFVKSKRDRPLRRNLSISYMGGGEPMLSWNIIKDSIEFAERLAVEESIVISFRIITNGSILSEEQLDFIKKHKIGLSISFEVLEDIQNLQRKHFEIVDNNLRLALQHGIETQLNVTVTPYNVNRIEETYHQMRNRYPEVRHAMFEPVCAQNMFPSPKDMEGFYDAYIAGFMSILALGMTDGVEITSFPYLRTVFPLKRACPGEFCITAEGNLTGCYCVSTDDHPLFDKTLYGRVCRDKVVIDKDVFTDLLTYNVNSRDECRECTARWNCGGGCFHQFQSHDEPFRKKICNFTRKFVEEIIKFRVYAKENKRLSE